MAVIIVWTVIVPIIPVIWSMVPVEFVEYHSANYGADDTGRQAAAAPSLCTIAGADEQCRCDRQRHNHVFELSHRVSQFVPCSFRDTAYRWLETPPQWRDNAETVQFVPGAEVGRHSPPARSAKSAGQTSGVSSIAMA